MSRNPPAPGTNAGRLVRLGSILAWLAAAALLLVPLDHRCIEVAVVRGGTGGSLCSWQTVMADSPPVTFVAVALFLILAPALPLLIHRRWLWRLLGGLWAALALATAFSFGPGRPLGGVYLESGAKGYAMLLLPTAVIWFIAAGKD